VGRFSRELPSESCGSNITSALGGTFLPYITRIHRGPKMFLDAIVAPHTPQALVLTAFLSFPEMIEMRGKIAAPPDIQRAGADRECGESQILITSADSLRFHDGPTRRRDGIFELRAYHAPRVAGSPAGCCQRGLPSRRHPPDSDCVRGRRNICRDSLGVHAICIAL
jgi:hypothetical protein